MGFIRHFKQLNSKNMKIAGGKGASLGELTRAGFRVPPGFVLLSSAFTEFVSQAGMARKITTLLESITDPLDINTINKVSTQIRWLIMNGAMQERMADEVRAAFSRLGADTAAVRSSAAVEDGPTDAWAGQLDSFLNVGGDDLIITIKKCWASLYGARALAYGFEKSAPPSKLSMAVIVQAMVAADFAGVAFSAHPVTGDSDMIVVEAAAGLGESLVSGLITPDNYVVSKKEATLLAKRIGDGTASGSTGNVKPTVPDRYALTGTTAVVEKTAGSLTDAEVVDLAETVKRIEAHFGFPVDVEWVRAGGQWQIVQSRPITALPVFKSEPKYTWSNLNIAEVMPGVNPPLVKDMILEMVQPAMLKILKMPPDVPLVRDIKGRLYFNVTAMEDAFRRLLRTDSIDLTALLGGEQQQAPAMLRSAPILVKLKIGLFALVALAGSFFLQGRFQKLLSDIRRTVDDLEKRTAATDDPIELFEIEDEALNAITRLAKRGFMLLAYPVSFFMIYDSLGKKWLKDEASITARGLMAGGGVGIPEIEALSDLWRLRSTVIRGDGLAEALLKSSDTNEALAVLRSEPTVSDMFDGFMAAHGHRCAGELNFSIARWSEDPTFIVAMLKQYLLTPDENDPRIRQHQLAAGQTEELERLAEKMPRIKFLVLRKLLNLAASGQYKRETMKSELVRLLGPLRSVLLKIGRELRRQGALDESDDVFMLTLEELRSATASNRAFDVNTVRARKAAYDDYGAIDLPPVIEDVDKIATTSTYEHIGSEGSLEGIAVSHGKVLGTARVIKTLAEIDKLRPGDILVTDHTDPGWTPVFAVISGLITNTGGLISHAAIVAREYGLPAVVNVKNATSIIADGQIITLDADVGAVDLA